MLEREGDDSRRQHLMHLFFEDPISDHQTIFVAENIVRGLLENPELGDHSPMGTIVWFDVSATGVNEQKPRGELDGDEYLLRLLILKHFESLE